MDGNEIQILIDRLVSLKKRQVALIDEQEELSHRLAETFAQNEQAKADLAAELVRAKSQASRAKPSIPS